MYTLMGVQISILKLSKYYKQFFRKGIDQSGKILMQLKDSVLLNLY